MFNIDWAKSKKINLIWWLVLGVAGAALVLYLQQLPSGPAADSNAATPQPVQQTGTPAEADSATEPSEEGGYLAEYDPDNTPLLDTAGADNRSGWEIALDFGVKLLIIVGLVYLVLYGIRWLQRARYKNISGGATINVLETTGLSPGRSLHLVVVGEKTLLLGATDHQISVLAELADAHVPLPDEESEFDEAFEEQQNQPQTEPAVNNTPQTLWPSPELQPQLDEQTQKEPDVVPIFPIPSLNVEEAVEYRSEWQSTMSNLRAGIRRIQETVEG